MDYKQEFFFNQRIQKIWRDFAVKWIIINLVCLFFGWILLFIPLIVSLIFTALDYQKVSDKVDFLKQEFYELQSRRQAEPPAA